MKIDLGLRFSGIQIRKGVVNFLVKHQDANSLTLEDLAVPLKVFYSRDVKHKQISFSLDPSDPKNAHSEFHSKTIYPD